MTTFTAFQLSKKVLTSEAEIDNFFNELGIDNPGGLTALHVYVDSAYLYEREGGIISLHLESDEEEGELKDLENLLYIWWLGDSGDFEVTPLQRKCLEIWKSRFEALCRDPNNYNEEDKARLNEEFDRYLDSQLLPGWPAEELLDHKPPQKS